MKKTLLLVTLILIFTFALSSQALATPLSSPNINTQPQDVSVTSANVATAELSIQITNPNIFGDLVVYLYSDTTGNGSSSDDVQLDYISVTSTLTPYTWTIHPSNLTSTIGEYHYYFKAYVNSTLSGFPFYMDDSDIVVSQLVTINVTLSFIMPPFHIVTFLPTPEISTQPADKTVTVGQSATLSVALTPPSGTLLFQEPYTVSYAWSSSSTLGGMYIYYLSSNSPTFTVTPTTAGTRYYKCTVTYTSNSDSTWKNSVTSDVAVVTAIETPAIVFNDVFTSDWFYTDVYKAVNMGLINGKSVNPPLFVPNGNLTIAEAIKLAACMRQYYETGSVTLTNGDPWYQPYVDYCGALGIIGYHQYDGRYNEPATRAEYAVIFANSLPASEFAAINNILNVPDVPTTASYRAAVLKLYNAGILEGTGTSHAFNPTMNIKRSEVAAILTRMMDDSARKTFSL